MGTQLNGEGGKNTYHRAPAPAEPGAIEVGNSNRVGRKSFFTVRDFELTESPSPGGDEAGLFTFQVTTMPGLSITPVILNGAPPGCAGDEVPGRARSEEPAPRGTEGNCSAALWGRTLLEPTHTNSAQDLVETHCLFGAPSVRRACNCWIALPESGGVG